MGAKSMHSQRCWGRDPGGLPGGRGSQRMGRTCQAQFLSADTSGHLPGTWELEGPSPILLKRSPWHLIPLRDAGGMCPASHPARRTGLSACQARAGPAPCALLSPLFLRPQEGRSRAKVIAGLAYLRGGLGTQSTGYSMRQYLPSQRTGPSLPSIHRRLDEDTQAQPHAIKDQPGKTGRA